MKYLSRGMGVDTMSERQLRAIPDYGDKFTLEEFSEEIACGMFTDDDGHGEYATDTHMDGVWRFLRPSKFDISFAKENGWTHVVWFNK